TQPMKAQINPPLPVFAGNANHHLWNNHGTFWCHFTLHLPDYTKQRLRLALGTRDFSEAQEMRDALLRLFGPLLPAAPATREDAR
ncbi:MAG TPA: hypothetical protein VL527_05380, partial [Dongiaceae bacterium]|nr:hypothetical protein [Dongiaceae bacterium]